MAGLLDLLFNQAGGGLLGGGPGAAPPPYPMQDQQPQQQPMQMPQQAMPQQLPGTMYGGQGGLSDKLQTIAGMLNPALGQNIMAQRSMNASYQALQQSGVPEPMARAAALNPEIMKTIAPAYFDTKPQFGVIGQNQMGVNQYGFIQPNQKKVTPVNGNGAMGSAGQIDPNLTGQDFLKAVSDSPEFGPGKAQIVKAIAEGRAPYPSGFLLKTPFGQWLTTAVGQYEPGVDANIIAQRRKMQTDLSASSPNSIGGILSNGKSAFEHLAELSDKAANLGNSNGYNGPGGGYAANAYNAAVNALGTSDQRAKIGAFNQNALKYGQESTKFYAGTGGGEAERMNALKSLNPETSSGLEQAAFLENEKGLMLDRLRQKEQQIRSIMGDAYLAKNPVMTPELQSTINKIDQNIAKLRGVSANAATSQPAAPQFSQDDLRAEAIRRKLINP